MIALRVTLHPDRRQHEALLALSAHWNAAANRVAEEAFRKQTANKLRLARTLYDELREAFGLPANHAIRAISAAAEAYKRNRSVVPRFDTRGPIVLDRRVLTWRWLDTVAITTLEGKELIPCTIDTYEEAYALRVPFQAHLVFEHGVWRLIVAVNMAR